MGRLTVRGIYDVSGMRAGASILVDLILERVNDIPDAERPAETGLGPWYDVCPPGCCENVRVGFKPAIAGIAP